MSQFLATTVLAKLLIKLRFSIFEKFCTYPPSYIHLYSIQHLQRVKSLKELQLIQNIRITMKLTTFLTHYGLRVLWWYRCEAYVIKSLQWD